MLHYFIKICLVIIYNYLIFSYIISFYVFAIDFVILILYVLLEIRGLNILSSAIFEERESTDRQAAPDSKKMSYTIN